MKTQTLNDIFFAIVGRRQERVMLVREASQWVPISSQELYRKVAAMARQLRKWGLRKGDRLAILSENRIEYHRKPVRMERRSSTTLWIRGWESRDAAPGRRAQPSDTI
jgi:hypothetical protein